MPLNMTAITTIFPFIKSKYIKCCFIAKLIKTKLKCRCNKATIKTKRYQHTNYFKCNKKKQKQTKAFLVIHK